MTDKYVLVPSPEATRHIEAFERWTTEHPDATDEELAMLKGGYLAAEIAEGGPHDTRLRAVVVEIGENSEPALRAFADGVRIFDELART